MSDLPGRLAALEDLVANLPLASLPLGALQRRLENDWQPDANVLLQPKSISADQLQAGVALLLASVGTDHKVAFGSAPLVWTAASSSAQATVTHGLGSAPLAVLAMGNSGLALAFYVIASSVGLTTFDLQGISTAVTTQTRTAYWLAIG